MKVKSVVSVLLAMLFLIIANPSSSRSAEEPVLELLQVKGISEETGSFRFINTPYFTQRNYYKQGMAFDQEGNLYITDSGDSQIEVFDKNLKPLRHFGSLGNGDGQFQYLADIKIDNNEIFTLDILLHRIQVFDLSGRFLYSFDTGLESENKESYPMGFAISLHENIFIADYLYGLKVFDRKGNFIRAIDVEFLNGEDAFGQKTIALEDMKSDENGNVYFLLNFTGDGSPLILVLNPDGSYLSENIYESAIFVSQYLTPNGCFAFEGEYFYALLWDSWHGVDIDNGNLLECFRMQYEIDTAITVDYESIEGLFESKEYPLAINNPTAFLVKDEILYILDSFQNKIIRMNLQGELIDSFESLSQDTENWQGIYGDNRGNLYTTNAAKGCIEVRDENLAIIQTIGKPGKYGFLPGDGEFGCPYSTVIDPKGYVYCSDFVNGCIQVFSPDQLPFMTYYPLEHLESPAGLYFDVMGNLVLLDRYAQSICIFDISHIEKKEIKLIKTIRWKDELDVPSLAITEKNTFLIPLRTGSKILAEMGDNGKIKRQWTDQLKTTKKEQIMFPRAIWKDNQQNCFLLDEWRGYIWKFTQDLKIDWIDNLNWFGIKEVWESNQGLMYALDNAHQVILVFRDHSFVDETPISLVIEPTPEVTYEDHITIKGKIEKDGSIRIGGETVNIDENGFFQKSLPLEIGENVWNVEATHPVKKAVTKEIKIVRKEKVIIQMQVNSKTVMINSQKKIIEAPPFLNSKVNRVFAPIRVVVEAIDGTVEWVATEQTVIIRKEDIELILIVNTPYAFLNGNKIWIDEINENNPEHPVVPTIVGGRVFLPLRFIGENLGFMVEWAPTTQGIVLTYPDPKRSKMLSFMNNPVNQSFSEVISFTLIDNGCFISPSPSPSGVATVMVPSIFNYTGVAKIDGSGKVLDSHAINTTGNILPLSNDEYLMISLLRGGFKKTDSLAFTWLDQQGKWTKSKRLAFAYEGIRIEEIKNFRETDHLGFEMIMIAYTPDEDDVFDGNQKIHLKFNAEGDLIETLLEQYPRYSNVNIGKIGSLVLIGYEPIKTLTLFDRNGKSVWSKQIQISKTAGEDPFGGFRTEWLSDDSVLLYYFHQKRLFLTRLKNSGEVLWNTTLSMRDNQQIYNLSKPILTSTGGIFLVLQVMTSNQKSFSNRIVSLDQSGKVIRCLGLNHARNFYFNSLVGSEEDFWVTGSTQHYAFGPSSAILFHYQGNEDTSCFTLEKDVMNSQALILIESNPKVSNIEIRKVKLATSLNDHEIAQETVRFLTKEICR